MYSKSIEFFLSVTSFFKNFGLTLYTILRILILSSFRNILKRPEQNEKKCIILGNGPSLSQTIANNSQEFMSSTKLCVNNFVLSDQYLEIKPEYYILNAPSYFQPDEKLSEVYINLKRDVFNALQVKTVWKLFILVPVIAKKSKEFMDILQKNENIKPIYFNQTPVEGFDWFKHSMFKMNLGMPRPHNVLIPSIMGLIALNYTEILIVGADHSWLSEITVNERNEAMVHQKHFYDEDTSKPKKMNDWAKRPRRLHEILHKFQLAFQGYWDIKKYAEKQNVQIYNCSEVSMIDAFDRRELK